MDDKKITIANDKEYVELYLKAKAEEELIASHQAIVDEINNAMGEYVSNLFTGTTVNDKYNSGPVKASDSKTYILSVENQIKTSSKIATDKIIKDEEAFKIVSKSLQEGSIPLKFVQKDLKVLQDKGIDTKQFMDSKSEAKQKVEVREAPAGKPETLD